MLLIPVALAATIAGLLLAPFYLIPQTFAYGLLGASVILVLFFRKFPRCLFFALLLFCFLLANLRYPTLFPRDSFVDPLTTIGRKVTVTAELQQLTHRVDGRSQLDLEIVQLADGDVNRPLTDSSRLRVYVDELVKGFLPGDILRFQTKLRKPRLFGTPGEFHWPRYLASQGIALTGWLKSVDQISVVGSSTSVPFRSIADWREHSADRINAAVTERQSLLVRALLLGESRILPDSIRQALSHAGVSHLFAISGLHLGLIGMLTYRLLWFFYRRSPRLLNWQPPQRVLPLLLLPLLLGYLLLTGDAISTRRAFCVAALVALFWLWRYTVNPLRLLMSLALLFLLFNPLLLWQPSWQLSFSGAAGILLWRPFWQDKTASLPVLLRAPVRLLLVTSAATLATLPLVMINFHLLAPAGLLANLIAVPLVALLALPIGLCGLCLAWVPLLGNGCFALSGYLLETVLFLVEKLLSLPGAAAHYLFLTRWQYLAIALLVLPLLLCAQRERMKIYFRFSAACLSLALLCGSVPYGSLAGLSLHMFSVGQGESILISDEQQAVLIDGGGLYSDRFDVGERLLAPAFGSLGIRHLSAVLLTHDHPDHRKGLIFILQQFPVDEFWVAGDVTALDHKLQQVLLESSIPVRTLPAGWSEVENWNFGEMQLFHSPDPNNKNDSSVSLYLQTQSDGLLLTGDLERNGVTRLLAAGVPGPVSLLKLPHHGSRHSASENLISQLQPKFCLVSAGFQNRYRLPAQQLTNQLQKLAIPLYRTDTMGTVRARNNGEYWLFDHWQNGLFR